MSVDGTWKITVQTPMGAQESTIELVSDGSALTGTQSGNGECGPDLRRQRRRRQRDMEGRHHQPDVADRHLQGEGLGRLDLGQRERRPLPERVVQRHPRVAQTPVP